MHSVRHSLAWMSAAQGSLFVLQFVISILVARILTPYEMGIFAVALSVVGVLSLIRSFGLGTYIIRAQEISPPLLATVFTINTILALIVSLATVGFSILGGTLLGEYGVQRLLLLMAIMPIIGVLDFLPATSIERRGDFRTIAIINIVRYSTANLATLGLAYAGYSYMSLGYGQLISAIVAMLLNNFFGKELIKFRFGLYEWREVTRYGTQMLAVSAIGSIQGRLADLIMAKTLGLGELGLFSRAGSLTGVLWENLQTIVLRVLFVDFSEQHRQGRSLRQSYLRVTQILTASLCPAFSGMAVISGPIIFNLLGSQWIGAAVPLALLAISGAISVPTMAAHDIFIVCGKLSLRTRIEMVRAPISLAFFTVGCLISLPAAAVMKIIEAFFLVVVYRTHVERLTDTSWADYTPIYTQSILLTATAVLPAIVAMSSYNWSPDLPLSMVIISVGCGILFWAAMLCFTRHPLFFEGKILFCKVLRWR